MKKTIIIVLAIVTVIIGVSLFYYIEIGQYNKVISALRNHDWDVATTISKSKLMDNPENHKLKGLLFYARVRDKFDEEMEKSVKENEDKNSNEIQKKLYDEYELTTIFARMLSMQQWQYVVENKLYNKLDNPQNDIDELRKVLDKELSVRLTNGYEMTKAIRYLSKIGINKLRLNKGDEIDNTYYNVFLSLQSGLGNKKADKILLKKMLVESSITDLFIYCGDGFYGLLKANLKQKPNLIEYKGIVEYLAIMKAKNMINEIQLKYPQITDISRTYLKSKNTDVYDSTKAKSDKIISSWNDLNSSVSKDLNLPYMKERLKALKTNKRFGLSLAIHYPTDKVEPILLSISAFDTKTNKFLVWIYQYTNADFQILAFEKMNNPVINKDLFTILNVTNDEAKISIQIGRIDIKQEQYTEQDMRYNPRKYKYYDYWSESYTYNGGYDYVDVTKHRDEAYLIDVKEYGLSQNKAFFNKQLKDIKVDDISSHRWNSLEESPVDTTMTAPQYDE